MKKSLMLGLGALFLINKIVAATVENINNTALSCPSENEIIAKVYPHYETLDGQWYGTLNSTQTGLKVDRFVGARFTPDNQGELEPGIISKCIYRMSDGRAELDLYNTKKDSCDPGKQQKYSIRGYPTWEPIFGGGQYACDEHSDLFITAQDCKFAIVKSC